MARYLTPYPFSQPRAFDRAILCFAHFILINYWLERHGFILIIFKDVISDCVIKRFFVYSAAIISIAITFDIAILVPLTIAQRLMAAIYISFEPLIICWAHAADAPHHFTLCLPRRTFEPPQLYQALRGLDTAARHFSPAMKPYCSLHDKYHTFNRQIDHDRWFALCFITYFDISATAHAASASCLRDTWFDLLYRPLGFDD
jgi:hypothetical protein